MPPMLPVVGSSNDELHLPTIPSAVAAPFKKRSVDMSKTESHGSSLVADEAAATRALTSSWSPNRSRHTSVNDPSSLSAFVVASTSTTNYSRLLSADTANDSVFNYDLASDVGFGNDGRGKSKEHPITVASFDEERRHHTSPRALAQPRDRRRQNGFRGHDERVIRSRLTRFNCTVSLNNVSKISGAFGATNNETTTGTRYSGNVTGSRFYHNRPEAGVSGLGVNPVAATGCRKNQLSDQFRSYTDDVAVRSQQRVTTQPRLFKAPANSTSLRQRESTVIHPITAPQTETRQERPDPGQTSTTTDDDDPTEDEQRERIISWLGSVSENAERPPSPDIDDSPTPVQTDTAIHVVYDGD